ncbi:MAG: SagB/ThcOx family dehydrogenase [Nitrospirae bacterium]|nr:SagB/ThcOx family dehydrogenase [Nitrospirota bacterium]
MDLESRVQKVIEYHERTKHYPDNYARSPGQLDWANQPTPFIRYEGAPVIEFPFMAKDPDTNYFGIYDRRGNPPKYFTFENVGAFLELSVGLSAWKSMSGDTWALRINPSSGNLHPTEVHLILPPLKESEDCGGLYHYNPYRHIVEWRAAFDQSLWSKVISHFKTEGFFVALSSIYWREAWKYGERAFRYCNHDVGHALACLSFSAGLSGWKVTYLNAVADKDIETILGFPRTAWIEHEKEEADLLCFVHRDTETEVPAGIPDEIIAEFKKLPCIGDPAFLSEEHVVWEVIDDVSAATVKETASARQVLCGGSEFLEKEITGVHAADIIRQRRSGQSYDGETAISRNDFLAILDKTIPRQSCAPFDVNIGDASVCLLIFVHRVTGLEPGLYFLFRNNMQVNSLPPLEKGGKGGFEKLLSVEEEISQFMGKCRSDFLWEKVQEVPDTLPLYLLRKGDYRQEAAYISCDQEIAGDGAFSIGMLARFRDNIENEPHSYRRLFWEAGMIGQVLYLEAEAHAMRGTGIGCYYDDLVHELLGLTDNTYQDIYHFTVGKALEDTRITTLSPYGHLKR